MSKTLLFGGTFDPIHNGHLIISTKVAEQMKFNKVILIPSARPPVKEDVADIEMRYSMIECSIGDNPLFKVSDCEFNCEYREGKPSYTIDTVNYFKNELGFTDIYWLIGDDNFSDLPNWHKIKELIKLCTFVVACSKERKFAMSKKDGYSWRNDYVKNSIYQTISVEFVEVPQINIRSTIIREKVKKGLSIKYLVPNSVEKIIKYWKFYN